MNALYGHSGFSVYCMSPEKTPSLSSVSRNVSVMSVAALV